VEFLIYEAMGEWLEIKKHLRVETEHMNYERLRVLGTSKKLSGETFDNC